MEEVPLTMMKCGSWLKKQPGCFLSVQESSPRLDFIWRNADADNNGEYIRFQCRDISAVDLRVEAKFGSIDAMKGTIIVECLSPVHVDIGAAYKTTSGGQSFIVMATFNVNETGAVRDVIRQLRTACSSRGASPSKQDVQNQNVKLSEAKITSFKEGLPGWVVYIPHYMYSKRTRQSIELAIFLYMIFSVAWALWQLHNHVDFVRESVAPLIDMLKYQYHLLDSMVQVLNTIFEEYTTQWLCLIKPLYTLATTLVSPVLKIFEQLGPLFRTILQGLTAVWYIFWPFAKPVISIGHHFYKHICTIFGSLKTLVARIWSLFNVSVPDAVTTFYHSAKRILGVMYEGFGQAPHLDPLKAQFIIMRTTVINSSKALGLAIAHLAKQFYKFIWLKRSAKAVKKE